MQFSTCAFLKLGRVRGNLLLYMKPINNRLVDRIVRIVRDMAEVDDETAKNALDENGCDIKKSVEFLEANK